MSLRLIVTTFVLACSPALSSAVEPVIGSLVIPAAWTYSAPLVSPEPREKIRATPRKIRPSFSTMAAGICS